MKYNITDFYKTPDDIKLFENIDTSITLIEDAIYSEANIDLTPLYNWLENLIKQKEAFISSLEYPELISDHLKDLFTIGAENLKPFSNENIENLAATIDFSNFRRFKNLLELIKLKIKQS